MLHLGDREEVRVRSSSLLPAYCVKNRIGCRAVRAGWTRQGRDANIGMEISPNHLAILFPAVSLHAGVSEPVLAIANIIRTLHTRYNAEKTDLCGGRLRICARALG